ncbi:MAG: flippase [Flavobacteriales bacterium]|nr:flippase [Flavobacteriales bacterium]
MIGSEGFKKYFQSFSWLFADRVVRLALVLLTGIFVTRYLGAEILGKLNYAMAVVSIGAVLTSMGMNEIISRDLVQHPERKDELLGSGFVIKLCGAILLNLFALVFALWQDLDPLTVLLIVITASGELFRWSSVIEYLFISRVQGRVPAKVNIVATVVGSGYKLVLVAMKAPILWFAAAYALETVVFAISMYIAYHNHGMRIRNWRPTRRMIGRLLQQSWPLLIYGIALQAQLKIDQIMIFDILRGTIGEEAANIEVGQYSVAVKMIEATAFLPVIIQLVLAPAISKAKVQDVELYRQRLTNQYRLMFLLYLTTSIPLYFVAEPLIVLLYGEEFRLAGHLLAIFAARLVFSYIGVAKNSFITNESLFKFSLVTTVIGAAINIGLNLALIPTMRSDGAIWATLVSFFVSVYLVDLFHPRTRINFKMMTQGVLSFWRIRGVR